MEEKNKTPCECPLAGYCDRHGMKKNLHYHKLCQNHTGYFDMWEKGRGPGQKGKPKKRDKITGGTEVEKKANEAPLEQKLCKFCNNQGCTGACRNNNEMPSTMQMAKNLAKATKDHVRSGLKTVSDDKIKERLDICGDCEHFVPHSSRCNLCGCFTKFKAKLKSGGCPIKKW